MASEGIKISSLASITEVTSDDILIVNDGNINTRKIRFDDFSKNLVSTSGDQTITGNITINGSITADSLSIDDDTLSIDAINNRVGINNPNPEFTLDVDGSINIRNGSTLRMGDADSSNYITLQTPAFLATDDAYTLPPSRPGQNGQVLSSDVLGRTVWISALLDPMQAVGDIVVRNLANETARLPVGNAGQVLTCQAGGDVAWQNNAAGFVDPMTSSGDIIIRNSANITTSLGIGTTSQVLLVGPTGVPQWGTQLGAAAGADSEVQFNSGGVLDARSSFFFSTVDDSLTVEKFNATGGVSLATDTTNPIAINGSITTDLIPTGSPDIGSSSQHWGDLYIGNDLVFKNGSNKNGLLNFATNATYEFHGAGLGENNTGIAIFDEQDLAKIRIGVPAGGILSSYNLVLPNQQGASGAALTNDGAGNLTWVVPGGPGSTPNLNDVALQGASTGVSLNVGSLLTVQGDGTFDGALRLNCSQNNHGVTIQAPPHTEGANYTLILPNTTGTTGQVLSTDGTGNLDWITASGGGGGAVDSVNGETGVVSLGIQDMDDFEFYVTGIYSSLTNKTNNTTTVAADPTAWRSIYLSGQTNIFVNKSVWDNDLSVLPSTFDLQLGGDPSTRVTVTVVNDLATSGMQRLYFDAALGRLDSIVDAPDGSTLLIYSPALPGEDIPLSAGDILQWNNADQKFKPAQLPGGGGGDASTFTWDASLIPDTNEAYDLGSAEYKVRHLFLSDNSIKFESGDLGVTGGKLTFDGNQIGGGTTPSDAFETLYTRPSNPINPALDYGLKIGPNLIAFEPYGTNGNTELQKVGFTWFANEITPIFSDGDPFKIIDGVVTYPELSIGGGQYRWTNGTFKGFLEAGSDPSANYGGNGTPPNLSENGIVADGEEGVIRVGRVTTNPGNVFESYDIFTDRSGGLLSGYITNTGNAVFNSVTVTGATTGDPSGTLATTTYVDEAIETRRVATMQMDVSETTVWIGEAAPIADPAGHVGWYYTNDANKIAWTLWSQDSDAAAEFKMEDFSSASFVIRNAGVRYPFINVYTKRKNDGSDAGTTYRSRYTYETSVDGSTGVVKLKLLTTRDANPIYTNLPHVLTPYQAFSSVGPMEPDEVVKSVVISTDSGATTGDYDFTLDSLVIDTDTEMFSIELVANPEVDPNTARMYYQATAPSAIGRKDGDLWTKTGTSELSIWVTNTWATYDLDSYATEAWVTSQNYASSAQGALADTAVQPADLSAKADLVNGLVPTSQIPSVALSNFRGTVADEVQMTSLSSAIVGDWCYREDQSAPYILTASPFSVAANWQEISSASAVDSVNGQAGTVVLSASDVGAATAAEGALAATSVQPADLSAYMPLNFSSLPELT